MKYLSIIFILIFSFTVFGQTSQSFSKGDSVVPKFPATVAKFDKVKIWQLAAKFTAKISKSPNGNYTINNFENWQTINYPLMQPLVVKEFELSKKKSSRVLLKGASLIIELFIPNDYNLQDVLSNLLFKGSVTAWKNFKKNW